MKTSATIITALVLIAVGLGIFAFKVLELGYPLKPSENSQSWHIEAQLSFNAHYKPVKASIFLPRFTDGFSIVDENFISDGYGVTTAVNQKTGNRVSKWSKRSANGNDMLFYRTVLYQTDAATFEKASPPERNRVIFGSAEFSQLAQDDPFYIALEGLIKEARERSADADSMVDALTQILSNKQRDSRIRTLREDRPELSSNADFIALVLNHSGAIARVVHGIELKDRERVAHMIEWVEVYDNNEWRKLENSLPAEVNGTLLPWWVGDGPAYTLEGGARPEFKISVKQHYESQITERIWKGDEMSRLFYSFSIYRLPIDVLIVFSVLLLLPLGCLIISVFRQIIGVSTLGTFSPILIAISFRETQLVSGMILFASLVGIGMVLRGFLDKLQLLMVPRLASILVGIVITMYLLNLLMFDLGITAGLSISLFPIVIMVMTIERISIMMDESGFKKTMNTTISSLFVSAVAYVCMFNDQVEHLMLTFPELLFVIMALIMLVGRYNGFKLLEIGRFKTVDMAMNPNTHQKPKA